MNLRPDDPLNSVDLAIRLKATIWSEQDIKNVPTADIKQLTEIDGKSWSAFTLRVGIRHLIVYNSTQSLPRINSVTMHELAHIALGHELHSASLTEDGHLVPSNYNQDQEDEANWLGGTLLLPRPALLRIIRESMGEIAAMDRYMASQDMLRWRIRMTGVNKQLGFASPITS